MEKRKRSILIGCWMSEEDVARLDSLMAMEGFRNRSKYLRKKLLGARVNARRNFRKTDANLTKQVLLLRTEIRKIGINYNQVVKAVNTLAGLRDKRGNAVITEMTVNGHLTDLKSMMVSALEKVDTIARDVIETESSAQEDSDNYH
ncbi:MAG: hypothetical protein IJQ93_11585 [Bacteroidales bacterium]|nr:hypothetical protein [Bacteroidales bacterium]